MTEFRDYQLSGLFPVKKLLLVLVVGLVSTNAAAEWRMLLEGNNSATYIDASTIHKEANLSRISTITDFKSVQTLADAKFQSIKTLDEYDCGEKRFRAISLTWFSEKMAQGEAVLSNDTPGEWQAINPASGREELWERSCD